MRKKLWSSSDGKRGGSGWAAILETIDEPVGVVEEQSYAAE